MQSPNEMSSGYKVFISYRRDGGYFIAELLKQYLKSHGIKAYLDLHDLQVLNRRWQDDIETHISMIPIFVLVVTHDMFAHKKDNEAIDWCEFEIGVALKDAQKNILQLVVNENGITVPDNSKKSKDRDIFIENAFHFFLAQRICIGRVGLASIFLVKSRLQILDYMLINGLLCICLHT